MALCEHLDQIKLTSTTTHVCEECVKIGDGWVHLRLCLECGHVGCCDSSKNKHATRHFRTPTTRSCARSSPANPGSGATWTRPCLGNSSQCLHSRGLKRRPFLRRPR